MGIVYAPGTIQPKIIFLPGSGVGRGLLSLLGLGAEGRLGHVVRDGGEGGPLEDELRSTRPAKTQFKSFYAVQSVI